MPGGNPFDKGGKDRSLVADSLIKKWLTGKGSKGGSGSSSNTPTSGPSTPSNG